MSTGDNDAPDAPSPSPHARTEVDAGKPTPPTTLKTWERPRVISATAYAADASKPYSSRDRTSSGATYGPS